MKTYKQTMKSLFVIGIPLFLICFVATFFVAPIYDAFNGLYHSYLHIIELSWHILVFMYIGSIFLTFSAFSYTNKRVSSDFNESLPVKRTNSFFQRILAVLTYQILTIIICMIAVGIKYMTYDLYISWFLIVKAILSYLAGSILIIGAISIAKALTGTRLSTLSLTFVILFLPRIILFTVPLFVYKIAGCFIPYDTFGILFDLTGNIPFAPIATLFRALGRYYNLSVITNTRAIIYSFVLGVAYLGIAALLFKKRKSEVSGKGCINNISGYIQSALLILPILMFAFSMALDKNSHSFTNWGYIAYLTALLFAVYLSFNLIYTRKVEILLKSIPYYIVSVLLCFGIFASGKYIAKEIIYNAPEVDEIEYVTLIENPRVFDNVNNDYTLFQYVTNEYEKYTYVQLLNKDIKFSDSEMINLVQKALEDQIDLSLPVKRYGTVFCEFHLKNGRTISRMITITDEYSEQFESCLKANEEYYENLIATTPYELITTFSNDHSGYSGVLKSEQMEEIWGINFNETSQLAEEYNVNLSNIPLEPVIEFPVTVSGKYKNNYFYERQRISAYTEETGNLMMSLISEPTLEIHENWNDVVSNSNEYKYMEITFKLEDLDNSIADDPVRNSVEGGYFLYYYYKPDDHNYFTIDQVEAILEIVKDVDYKDIDCTKDYLSIDYTAMDVSGNFAIMKIDNLMFLPVSEEQSIEIYNIIKSNS